MNPVPGLALPSEHQVSNLEIWLGSARMLADCSGVLYWPDEKTLIVSDLHLEKSSSYARRGRFLPPYDSIATLKLLNIVLDIYQPKTVISLGDSFHDGNGWGRLTDESAHLLSVMMEGRDWVWVSGNHDPEKPSDFAGRAADEIYIDSIALRHEPLIEGTAFDGKNPGLGRFEISGHLHPTAKIRRRGKSVRRRCFASDGQRLILPSFGVLTGGLCLRHEAFDGLFSKADLTAYMLGKDRVYPVAERHLG